MFKKLLAFLLFILLIFNNNTLLADDWNDVRKGIKEYNNKNSKASIEHFQKALEHNPDNPLLYYNLGDAYYQQENFEEAEKFFKRATVAKNKGIKQKSFFNLGNTFFKSQKMDKALEAYKQAIDLDPVDIDAKYNYEYAKRIMQQQQQQNQDQKDNKSKDKQDKDQQNQNKEDKEKEDQEKQQDQKENKQEKNQDKKDKQQQQKKQDEKKIDKKTAEQILEALRQKEKENQKKAKMYKGKPIKVEKDW